jgi:hypothetical protein
MRGYNRKVRPWQEGHRLDDPRIRLAVFIAAGINRLRLLVRTINALLRCRDPRSSARARISLSKPSLGEVEVGPNLFEDKILAGSHKRKHIESEL